MRRLSFLWWLILTLIIFCSLPISSVFAVNFSEELFPKKLERDEYYYYVLKKVEKENVKGYGTSFIASYEAKSDKPSVIIYPSFNLYVSLRKINNKQAVEEIIPLLKERFEKNKGKKSFYTNPLLGNKINYKVKGYEVTSLSYSLDDIIPGDLIGGTKYYGGSIMYTTLDNYLVLTEVFYTFGNKSGKRDQFAKEAVDECEITLGNFIDLLKGQKITEQAGVSSFFSQLFGKFFGSSSKEEKKVAPTPTVKPTPPPKPTPTIYKASPPQGANDHRKKDWGKMR